MKTTRRIAAIALTIMLPPGIASAADTNRSGSTQSHPAGLSMKMHQTVLNMVNMVNMVNTQMSGDSDKDFAQR